MSKTSICLVPPLILPECARNTLSVGVPAFQNEVKFSWFAVKCEFILTGSSISPNICE